MSTNSNQLSTIHRLMWYVGYPLRFALAGLFLLAAYQKLKPNWELLFASAEKRGAVSMDTILVKGPQTFSESVRAFKLPLPDVLVRLATSATPWVELICGICLIVGIWVRGAAAVLAGLLVLFIILIVQALARGLNVKCGCFGDLSPFCSGEMGACHLIQNSVMLAAALFIVATPRAAKTGKLTPNDLRK